MKTPILIFVLALLLFTASPKTGAAPRKPHVVTLGAARKVPYSRAGDPAGAVAGEQSLKIRTLLLDGVQKEWTTGDAHDVTDRGFVVRRAIRLNDALPDDAKRKRAGSGSAAHGSSSIVSPATSRRSSFPTTIPA